MNSQYTLTCCWIRSSCEIRSSLRWRFSSRMRVASRPLKLKQRNMMIFHRSYYTKNAVYLILLKFWLRKDSKLKEMYLDTFNWEKNLLGSLFSQKTLILLTLSTKIFQKKVGTTTFREQVFNRGGQETNIAMELTCLYPSSCQCLSFQGKCRTTW